MATPTADVPVTRQQQQQQGRKPQQEGTAAREDDDDVVVAAGGGAVMLVSSSPSGRDSTMLLRANDDDEDEEDEQSGTSEASTSSSTAIKFFPRNSYLRLRMRCSQMHPQFPKLVFILVSAAICLILITSNALFLSMLPFLRFFLIHSSDANE